MDNQEALAKLQELIDRQEIHDALQRYCRGCDRADAEMIASAFWPDAINELGGRRTPAEFAPGVAASETPHMIHFTGNLIVELEGDTAYAESYFLSFATPEVDGTLTTRSRCARYLDRFERRDGEWRIAHRIIVDEWARIDPVTEIPSHVGAIMGVRGPEDPVFHMRERLR